MQNITEISAIHYETNLPVKLKISNGVIINILEMQVPDSGNRLFVAPGLIDNQINGYRGTDFSSTDLSPNKIKNAVEEIVKDGVTSFQPTVITNSHKNLLKIFNDLAEAMNVREIRDSVPGFHMEGPYLSPEEGYYGCHSSAYIRKPSWKEFLEYQEAADGNIRQVTLSPEIEGAIEFIKLCTENNIIAAIGHTNATNEQIRKAVDYGATISTHLGNGCANLIDRHRNPLWPQLANDLLVPSIIADGHHLLPEEILVFYKVKGPDNIILTSDVTYLKGMAPGRYIFMGSEIEYTTDGLIRNPVLNCLAGASFPIKTGVENMMDFTGCSLGEAINLATRNVARICHLPDRGSLEPGKRADLILFEKDGHKLNIKQVWVNGRII